MLLDVVLHNSVVSVSIDADVGFTGKAKIHDAAEDTMCVRQTGYTMMNI